MDHTPRWHLARWTVGLHCKFRAAAKQRIKHVSQKLVFSSRLRRVARSSSAAETQAAADDDDETVYIRLCWICETGDLKRDKFLLLWWWTAVAWLALRLLVSVLKTRNLAWKHLRSNRVSLSVRWCHSAAQSGDVVTKRLRCSTCTSGTVRSSWFSLEIEHDPKMESLRKGAKRGIDTLDEPQDNQFTDDVPRDPKSVTLIT